MADAAALRMTAWAPVSALRPHQWVKNLIVLLPVATAHAWDRLPVALLAAAACCAAASAIYLVNDWCDRTADAVHPRKRHRAIASGALGGGGVALLALLLAAIASGLALTAGATTAIWLAGYALLAILYSAWLKRVLGLDVVLLTGFYLVRLGIGAAAVEHVLSPWLAVFAAGAFGSLACLKRVGELAARGGEARRAWRPAHLPALTLAGALASAVAVVTLAAYPLSATANLLYPHPWFLALPALPLAWWLLRVWRLGRAGRLHHDPVAFALRDPGAWAVVGVAAGAVLLGAWR
jgi:4-hydroxybenzoate polyprenyltransferase